MKMPFIPKAAKNQQGFTETVKRRGGFFLFSPFSRRDGEFEGMEEWVRQPPNILPPSNSSGQRSFPSFPIPHNQSLFGEGGETRKRKV